MTAYALSLMLLLTHGRSGPYTRSLADAIGHTATNERDARALVAVAWIECRFAQWCAARYSAFGLTATRAAGELPAANAARIALDSWHRGFRPCETAFGAAYWFNSGDVACRWRRCPRERFARQRCIRARGYAVRVARILRSFTAGRGGRSRTSS